MAGGALAQSRAPEFVGRAAERARIDAFLSALPSGARALTIRGEPGIGKTVLWRYGLQRCRDAGWNVLLTRASEDEMSFALVGLTDLFEGEDLGVAGSGDEDMFARGRSVLLAMRRLAEAGPVVVAVDDLQWLDPGSARALKYALRRFDSEPVGVLATVRTDHAAEDRLALDACLPPGRSETCDVGPLTVQEVREVLAGTLSAISRPTLRRIHQVSGGNPLYAIELARGVAEGDLPYPSSAVIPLPESLAGAIARRLDAVAPELLPMLEVISALGRVSVAELAASLSIAESQPLPKVEELLTDARRSGLLVVDDELNVRFAHPMTASAVYGRMAPEARRRLHERLASQTTDPDLLARHLALSIDEPEPRVAMLLEEAAERARAVGASDVAAELARQSLRLTPARDVDDAQRRAVAEIVHLAAAGEASRAVALADELLAAAPPGPGRAAALIQRFYVESEDLELGDLLLTRALDDAGEDEVLRGRVLDVLGWLRGMFRGDLRGGIECARQAAMIAERVGDEAMQMLADGHLAHMEGLAGRPRWELLERAALVAGRIGGPRLGGGPRAWLAKHLLWAGDLGAARAQMEAVLAEHVSGGNELERPYRLYDVALLDWVEGNLARAEESVREGIEAARDAENADAECWLLYPLGLVQAWTGRDAEARATAQNLMDWAHRRGGLIWAVRSRVVLGNVALSLGEAPDAARELVVAARQLDEMGFAHPGYIQALPDALEALAWTGDTIGAAALLERLEAQAAALGAMWPTAAAERSRGILRLALGETKEAATTLERVARVFDRTGHRPDAARAVLAQGRALMRAGHRSRGADALADARDRFVAMGATPWAQQAERELERVAPGRAARTLTERERAVAELVVLGRRNREIGAQLFMSVATVEAHLTRTYRKLGIRSRSELVRVMAEMRTTQGS